MYINKIGGEIKFTAEKVLSNSGQPLTIYYAESLITCLP